MSQIPDWWLIVTGVASILFVVLIIALVFMVITLIKLVRELQKPVMSLVDQVHDLVPEVKNLVVKVEELTVKVEGIADSTKVTVDAVGERAQGIAKTLDHVTTFVSSRMQQYAPIISTVVAGIRLFSAYREYKGHGNPKVRLKGTETGSLALEIDSANGEQKPQKGIVKGRRGVEQSGSSSGS